MKVFLRYNNLSYWRGANKNIGWTERNSQSGLFRVVFGTIAVGCLDVREHPHNTRCVAEIIDNSIEAFRR